ncbi:MAG: hypothetical protein J5I47_04060 [Vicingus serpentipes]|nr:hypothetical protein [Vicingus serpentipes]
MRKISIILVSLFLCTTLRSQVVLEPITSSVYEFLDEMAQMKYIELNSSVKPYTRVFIAQKLQEVEVFQDELNKRQRKELAFYFQDFNKELKNKGDFKKRKDLFFYKDSLFTLTVNPILGYEYATNSTGDYSHYWNGGEFYGYVGKHFGFSASLRDNGVSDILMGKGHLTPEQGANFKINQGQTGGRSDYSEMRGAIHYSWKWGRLGVVKDNYTWGDNYHGANIRSNKAPSIGYIDFNMKPTKWVELNYTHSWLVSEILDTARIYSVNNQERKLFMNKNMAANIITFKPFSKLHFSLGNSIVYSDDGIKPYYLIPFMFYKSIDHTYNAAGSNALGQNTQMFMNISSRQIKHLHLYTSIYVDEISIGNIMDKKNSSNIYSAKVGFKLNNLLLQNTYLIAEYTRTNPWTYRHQIESTTYASNQYNLGHYLGENAQEIYLEGGLKVLRGLKLALSYTNVLKGPDHIYQLVNGEGNVKGLPFMKTVAWKNQTIEGAVRYEIINGGYVYAKLRVSDVKGSRPWYTPNFYQGNQTTISGGINFGF